ncbi:hypothetical protein SODALDRAFT_381821 [Sodiomyces alkalinus F11]|uniref:Uncharacterized protein n=1 Tax=Sodiomyces alkalinus (strain CBS 110278 / VKM F-3762 / F11) TaxID=1314773 RepID=A0A3N2PK83_SODAK|nr:hypothetical protein SODALDRAFT_381821 [Sodiomyces alkalinus F11]ROT34840.1 hypothetical protein SODALDRAFT_381821 [Sodiomyces alkalinus F11]
MSQVSGKLELGLHMPRSLIGCAVSTKMSVYSTLPITVTLQSLLGSITDSSGANWAFQCGQDASFSRSSGRCGVHYIILACGASKASAAGASGLEFGREAMVENEWRLAPGPENTQGGGAPNNHVPDIRSQLRQPCEEMVKLVLQFIREHNFSLDIFPNPLPSVTTVLPRAPTLASVATSHCTVPVLRCTNTSQRTIKPKREDQCAIYESRCICSSILRPFGEPTRRSNLTSI